MTARRKPAGACANPVCGAPIYADQTDAITLVQDQPNPDKPGDAFEGRWRCCDIGCTIQYLELCLVKHRAHAAEHHVEEAER